MAYTIKEVEEKTGISSHTLRYWSKAGLLFFVERDSNDVRYFNDDDISRVAMIHCLRQTGLSIKETRDYMELCFLGDDTLEERYKIIKKQREAIKNRLVEYNQALKKLNGKVQYYEDLIAKKVNLDELNPNKRGKALKQYFNTREKGYKGLGDNAAKELRK